MTRPRVCGCGRIVRGPCDHCKQNRTRHGKTTTERGYGWDHRQASELYRTLHPLCECCAKTVGVIRANESVHMHHIHKIATNPNLRMDRSNWLAVCLDCHDVLENDPLQGMEVKRWSVDNYDAVLNQALGGV